RRLRSNPPEMAGVPGWSVEHGRSSRLDVSVLLDPIRARRPSGPRGNVRVLLLLAARRRRYSTSLPGRRPRWSVPLGGGMLRAAKGRAGRALRGGETYGAESRARGRSIVAVQPRRIRPSVSRVVPCDRSHDPASVSAHAAVGAIREAGRSGQGGQSAPVSRAPRAAFES